MLAGCSGLPSLDDLKALPEAGLAPEGATHIYHTANPRENTIEGPIPAILGDIFGVQMSPDELYAWYDRELEARGWQSGEIVARTTAEDAARGWRKGDVVIRVAVIRKGDPRTPAASLVDRYETIFEIDLIAEPRRSFAPIPT